MKDSKVLMPLFMFMLIVFALFSSGHYSGDGIENYLVAESIVLDRDLSIYDRPLEINELTIDLTGRGSSGRYGRKYSSYPMGMAILLVPFYFLGIVLSKAISALPSAYITQFFVALSNPVFCAGIAVAFFALLKRLGYSLRVGLIVTAIISFCTMNFIYARSSFSEPAVALCFVVSLYYLVRYVSGKAVSMLFCSGIMFAAGIFIKKQYAIYIVCYMVSLFVLLKGSGFKEKIIAVLSFCLPVSLCVAGVLFFNYLRFGDVSNTEYGSVSDMIAKGSTGVRYIKAFYYYVFSSGKGYFFYNPPLFLALFGIVPFLRRNKIAALYAVSFISLNLLFCVWIFQRGSLFSWGPRYLFVTIPFMGIFLAEYISGIKKTLGYIVVSVFSLLGFIVQLPSLFVNFSRWLFFVKEKLVQPEFLINFVPDLSPLKGSFVLFVSLCNRIVGGESLNFTYAPDNLLVEKVTGALNGYDFMDTWWAHVIAMKPGYSAVAVSVIVFMCILASMLFFKIKTLYLQEK